MRPKDLDMFVKPYIKVCLPSDEVAVKMTKRAVQISSIIEVIGESETVESLCETQENSKFKPYAGKRFKVKVEAIGEKLKRNTKLECIEKLDLEAMKPHHISLKDAEVKFKIVLDSNN